MLIGEVSKQIGISVEAIRFYEKQGLIDKPSRNASGYRDYPHEIVEHVLFIKRAKELGFSLKEINGLMSLRYTPGTTCDDIKKQAEAKIEDIDRKMADLQNIRKILVKLVSSCPSQGPVSECPIIQSIEKS